MEFNPYQPYPPAFGEQGDGNNQYDPFFNPSVQYEQAYMYYRYLAQQVEYKIKCKEYENLQKNEKVGK